MATYARIAKGLGIMVTFESDGSLTFRVYLPHAASVELLADFNGWKKGHAPLQRCTEDGTICSAGEGGKGGKGGEGGRAWEGWWQICVAAPDGDHAFSYLVDGQWWLPDYAAHGVRRNEYGNWTSLLFVPLPRRLSERMAKRKAELLSA